MFQYISCYSLSCGKDLFKWESWEFQYISCYSLSVTRKKTSYRRKLFQYISCYSLSHFRSVMYPLHICFNTSHVTLYLNSLLDSKAGLQFQYISCYSLSSAQRRKRNYYTGFNTSHVTLYPGIRLYRPWQNQVSIHLMLLFIWISWLFRLWCNSFQYISCYSLSEKWITTKATSLSVSIHLMLLFIWNQHVPVRFVQ